MAVTDEQRKRFTVWMLDGRGQPHHRLFKAAPTDRMMIGWAHAYHPIHTDQSGWFLIRYFPRFKGWKVLDVRQARLVTPVDKPNVSWYTGVARGVRVYPSPDAAIMHLLAVAYQQRVDD